MVVNSTVGGSNRSSGKIFFSSPRRQDRLLGSPNLLLNRYRHLFPGVKRPGSHVGHLPSTSAEVKSKWSYTSIPPYALIKWQWITLPFTFHVSYDKFSSDLLENNKFCNGSVHPS